MATLTTEGNVRQKGWTNDNNWYWLEIIDEPKEAYQQLPLCRKPRGPRYGRNQTPPAPPAVVAPIRMYVDANNKKLVEQAKALLEDQKVIVESVYFELDEPVWSDNQSDWALISKNYNRVSAIKTAGK